jgi:hypothetical protein
MSKGLTYNTKDQAEATAEDLRSQGLNVVVVPVAGGKWKIYRTTGEIPSEPEKFKELEDVLEVEPLAEEEKEIIGEELTAMKEERKARRAATRPSAIQKRKLEIKQKELARQQATRKRRYFSKNSRRNNYKSTCKNF